MANDDINFSLLREAVRSGKAKEVVQIVLQRLNKYPELVGGVMRNKTYAPRIICEADYIKWIRGPMDNAFNFLMQDLISIVETYETNLTAQQGHSGPINVFSGPVEASIIGSQVTAGRDVNITFNKQVTINTTFPGLSHYLTALPYTPEIFVGRSDDIEFLRNFLAHSSSENNILMVQGEGGIGKSTMVAKYFHLFHKEYHHVAWINCASKTPIEGLQTLAVQFGLQLDHNSSLDERLNSLQLELIRLESPCLLVLDDVESLEHLDDIYTVIRSIPNFHVIITSRLSDYEQLVTHTLLPLQFPMGLTLFEFHYIELDDDDKRLLFSIYNAIDGNTLVIELLAKNLRKANRLNQEYSLQSMLQDLQSKGLFQLEKDESIRSDYRNLKRTTPREVIAAIYELNTLNSLQKDVLAIFAALPNMNIAKDYLDFLVPEFGQYADSLRELCQYGWVGFDREFTQTFRCSVVVTEVVREKTDRWRTFCTTFKPGLISLFESDTGNNFDQLPAGFRSDYVEIANFVLVKCDEATPEQATLLTGVGNYIRSIGRIRESANYVDRSLKVCEKLVSDNSQNLDAVFHLATSLGRKAQINKQLGELQTARELLARSRSHLDALLQAAPHAIAIKYELIACLNNQAEISRLLNDKDSAQKEVTSLYNLCSALYEDNPNEIRAMYSYGVSCENMSVLQMGVNEFDLALEFRNEAIRIGRLIFEHDRGNRGSLQQLVNRLLNQATLLTELGDLQDAGRYCDEILGYQADVDRSDLSPNELFMFARTHQRIADLLNRAGLLDSAIQHALMFEEFASTLMKCSEDRIDAKLLKIESSRELAELYSLDGNYGESLKYANLALSNNQAIPIKDSYGKALTSLIKVKSTLCNLYFFTNNVPAFNEVYSTILKHVDSLSVKSREAHDTVMTVAGCLSRLSNVLLKLNRLTDADQTVRTSVNMSRSLKNSVKGLPSVCKNLGITLGNLAEVQFVSRNYDEALATAFEMRGVYESCFNESPPTAHDLNLLAAAYGIIGKIYQAKGDSHSARKFYLQDRAIANELVIRLPGNPELQYGLAISYLKTGEVAESTKNAIADYRICRDICIKLLQRNSENKKYKLFLQEVTDRINKLLT